MGVMSGFSTETGERVFVLGGDNAGFYEDVYSTAAWKRFESEFGFAENKGRLGEIVNQLHGGSEHITVSQFVDALNAGMDAGEFNRKAAEQAEPEAPAQVDVPKDKNGRQLSASQIAWGEMARWSQTASSEQIKERRKTDPAFANFYRKNLEREIAGVGDAAVDLNAPVSLATKVSDDLKAFTEQYRRTPVAEVRRLSRADSNPNGYVAYNSQISAATAAGLI